MKSHFNPLMQYSLLFSYKIPFDQFVKNIETNSSNLIITEFNLLIRLGLICNKLQ